MSDTTPRLSLPLIAPAQAQKHITHNEALLALDRLVHLTAADRRNEPSAAPAEGVRHLVGDAPTGAFGGHADEVATFEAGFWRFEAPAAGWLAWLSEEDAALVFDGTTWRDLKPRRAERLGVGTPADDTNRLAVASPAVLFTHAGEGAQVKVNKAAPADTASLLFQTGWSGRAEIGTAGDDKLHVKVSADGAVWTDALVVDSATGHVGIGTAAPAAALELVAATVSPSRGIVNTQITANAAAALAAFRKARGTAAAPAAAESGDYCGAFSFSGHDGTAYLTTAGFGARITGAVAAGSMPQDLFFYATGGAPTSNPYLDDQVHMVVTGTGRVGVGTTAPRVTLEVDGPVMCKSYAVAGLPAAGAGAGQIVMVADESGGPVLAFSDGTAWRRVTDRAVVT